MVDLNVGLYIRAKEYVSGVANRVRGSLLEIGEAGKKSRELLRTGADLSLVQQGVSRFADTINGALESAVLSAEAWEDKMALISAQSGGLAGKELKQLSEGLRNVARDSRVGFDGVAQASARLAVAGFDAVYQLDAVAASARLATATGADLAAVSVFTAETLRGFALSGEDAVRVTDVLRSASGKAGVSIQEMGNWMQGVAPKAHQLGLTLEGTAALVAGFEQAGIKGQKGLSIIDSLLSKMASRDSGSIQAFMELGMDAWNIGTPAEVLEQMAAGIERFSEPAKLRGLTTMFGEAGAEAELFLEAIQDGTVDLEASNTVMLNAAGTVEKYADITGGTGTAATERLGKSAEELSRVFGQALSPATERLKSGLADALDGIVAFTKANPNLVRVVAITAAAVGGFASLLAGALSIATAVSAGKAALIVAGGFKSIAASAGAAAIPLLAIGLAIGAITLAIVQLVKHWDELDLGEGFTGILESIGEAGILTTIGRAFDPRTLLKDMGVIGGPEEGGPQRMTGSIGIHVTSEGQAKVRNVESAGGIDLDVSTGLAMLGGVLG